MTEETKIHFDRADVLARAHSGRIVLGHSASNWREVTCDACKLERPAESAKGAPEYRVPADVLQRDAEVGREDFRTFRLARLGVHLADTLDAEEYALRMIREFSSLLLDAVALKTELTGLIGRVRASQGVPQASEAVGGFEGAQAVSGGPMGPFHAFVRGFPSEMGCGAPDLGLNAWAGRCGRPANDPVHAYVITREDVRAMHERMTPERYRRTAPVNAVDIRTDAGYAEGMTNLSDAAVTALLSAPGSKVGNVVGATFGAALTELHRAGLIGVNGGLTVKGSIERERLVAAKLDEAFGS